MTTRATVQVLLEVEVPDRWGDECTIGQVRKQALQAAETRIGQALQAANRDGSPEIRILGVLGRQVSVFEERNG